jgi:DNA-directed RNA polymerase specialized sigma24 family protein
MGLAEISDMVGVPVGTVKSRLHYATRHLRAALSPSAVEAPVEAHTG